MNSKLAKKTRKIARGKVSAEFQKLLPRATADAVLSMRQWPFAHRLKFAWWLMVGRGKWKGVE